LKCRTGFPYAEPATNHLACARGACILPFCFLRLVRGISEGECLAVPGRTIRSTE
jgi:hypothetical protein